MGAKQFSGVYAAMLTPRTDSGGIDTDALKRLVAFLLAKGIHSISVNGATGEFCLTAKDELRAILRTVRDASGAKAEILCGVGSAGSAGALELVKIAEEEGAAGVLLPMPYFFRYGQDDLALFCRTVAGSTHLPVLLYNLPQFCSGLEKETVHRLICENENIVGVKDSSGSLEILRHLNAHGEDVCRIVGNDAVLAQAISENICDGVVSGVACALPELVLDMFNLRAGSEEFRRRSHLLDEFVTKLNQFPVPWALKWAVEARGLAPATFSQPVSEARKAQANEFTKWFREWIPAVVDHG